MHYWTSVSLRRLYISQFPSLHFKDRDDGFVSKGSKDVLHGNKIFPCIIEFTKSASFVVIFVVVCGHLGRIYDLCFGQKCWKSYYSCNKNKLSSCEIIRSIQQATSISFFFFVGNQSRNPKKTNFALSGSRSEHRFHVRSRVPLLRINSTEIGKTCQQKWKFQHQKHYDHDFFITFENETSLTTRLIILVFETLWNIDPPPRETWHGNRRRWINFCLQMFELRIYKVVSSITSNWLSIRVRF